MALSFPTKQTPPQANRSATYSLIAHSKVALATITTFQHAVVRTQNAGPAFSNGPQRHTECYTYPDTNGIMSACGYLKKNVKTQSTGQWKQALWEKTLHASFTSLHSQAHVSPFPCTLAEATSSPHVSLWENIWRVGVGIPICVEGCERHYPPPPATMGTQWAKRALEGNGGFTNEFSVDFDIGKCLFCDSLQSNFAASPSHMKRFQRKYLGHIII